MELPENFGKYIIPLDTTDLSLFPLFNINPNNHKRFMPLWHKSNLKQRNEDIYYEFEILVKKEISSSYNNSKDNLSCSEICKEVPNLCYLCNIEVPVPYMREHLDSPKHRTYLKIAEIALVRVRKQMNQNYTIEQPLPNTYYCQTCVLLVLNKDKIQHLKSQTHRNALLIDKLLKDFLNLYSDEELHLGESETETELYKESNDIVQVDAPSANVEEIDVPSTNDWIKLTNEPVSDGNQTISDNLKAIIKSVTISIDTNFKDYIAILASNATNKIKYIDEYYMKIITEDGVRLKVKHENYHSFVSLGKRHIQCKLCTMIVRDMKEHMISQDHLEKVMLPIDKHCIRELNETKNHCVLCNDIVENADIHALCNKIHDTMLSKAMLFEDVTQVVSETFQIEPEISVHNIIENQNNIHIIKNTVSHVEVNGYQKEDVKDLHDERESTENKLSDVITVNNPMVPINVKDLQNECERSENNKLNDTVLTVKDSTVPINDKLTKCSDSNEYFCSVCYIIIHANDLNTHANGVRHKSNEKLDIHYIFKYSTTLNKLKCRVCRILFPIDMFNEHLANPKHIATYNTLLTANNMKKTNRNVFCELCIAYMRIGNELIHMESSKHTQLRRELKATSVPKHTKNCKTLNTDYCDVCQTTVPKTNMQQHYNGVRHKRNLAITENVTKDAEESKTNEIQETKKKKKKKENVNTALKGTTKLDSLNTNVTGSETLVEHKLTDSGDVVNPIFIIREETKIDAKDENKLYLKPETSGCNKNMVSETGERFEDLLDYTWSPNQLMCRICQVTIENTPSNIREHFISSNHVDNLRILADNHLMLKENIYYCKICCKNVAMGEQFNHIVDHRHIVTSVKSLANEIVYDIVNPTDSEEDKNNNELPSTSHGPVKDQKLNPYVEIKLMDNCNEENVCKVCNVKIPYLTHTVELHMEGKKHNAQFKELLSKNHILEIFDDFYCTVCHIKLVKVDLIKHLRMNKHLTKLESLLSVEKYYCKLCEIDCNKKLEEHIFDEMHKLKLKQKTQTKPLCYVCDVKLSSNPDNIREHTEGLQHRNNIKVMEANTIILRDNKCYCHTCDMLFMHNLTQQHISTSQHLILIGADVAQ